jgi:Phage integrase family
VIRSYCGSHLTANSVTNWFVALYKEFGYEGCSSHSGRRSFITIAARNTHRSGCSLRDVQLLAGHRSIETTERYIDGDTCAQRRLVAFFPVSMRPPKLYSVEPPRYGSICQVVWEGRCPEAFPYPAHAQIAVMRAETHLSFLRLRHNIAKFAGTERRPRNVWPECLLPSGPHIA